MIASWIDAMKRASVVAVASSLRMKIARPRGASGGSLYGCPACGAECRHGSRGDRRGAVGLRRDGRGWRCFGCNSSGDAIDLVAYSRHGRRYRDLGLVERTSVAEWCREFTNTERSATTLSSVAPVLPLPVEYPAQADVDALWSTSTAIADGCDAARYLYFRGVQPRLVRERDTARQLANGGAPEWAGSWSSSQHRLVIPMFDASGQMRSVLARSIERAPKLKSLAPRGFGRAGLVMACPAALEILRTGTRPSGFRNGWLIVIAEGEVDFLSAIQTSGSSHVAHFGIVSGSWTAAHAARIPDAATILLATDQDEAGERYAHAIASTFRGRNLTVKRWRPRAASEVQS